MNEFRNAKSQRRRGDRPYTYAPASPRHPVTPSLRHPVTVTLRAIYVLLSIYLFIYVFALPMVVFDLVPAWGNWMGGFLNVLQGMLLALWLVANAGARGAATAGMIAVLSLLIEYIGVTTGVPFGRYEYGATLGYKLLGEVPLPIPFAWLVVVPGALITARLLWPASQGSSAPYGRLLPAAAALVVLYDLLLEPFAVYVMEYWRWIDGGPIYAVPAANFLAWGATGLLLAALALLICGRRLSEPALLPLLPALLYALNLLQFTLVDLAYGYLGAGLLGLAVLAFAFWRLPSNKTIRE